MVDGHTYTVMPLVGVQLCLTEVRMSDFMLITFREGLVFNQTSQGVYSGKPKTGENRHASLWTKKWLQTYEEAELAQNRGQIWTLYA